MQKNDNIRTKKLLSTIKINEYEKLKELKSQSDEELSISGLSESEIKDIKNLDYAKELKKRIKSNEKELSSMRYSKEQIELIQSLDLSDSQTLTEDQLTSLSATCTVYLWEYGHFYSSSSSEIYLESDFYWDSIPVFVGTDILAMAWSDGMYPDVNVQEEYSTYFKANYYTVGGVNFVDSSAYTVIGNTNIGAYSKFPMRKAFSQSGFTVQGYCMDGFLQVHISKKAAVPEVSVLSQYGHSTITASPTVSFKGAPSITFSSSMVTADEHSWKIDLTIPY